MDYEGIIAAANGSVKAKQLAAQMIPKFFKFFPDLSEQALDQHLYLCEDEELGVSIYHQFSVFFFEDRFSFFALRLVKLTLLLLNLSVF